MKSHKYCFKIWGFLNLGSHKLDDRTSKLQLEGIGERNDGVQAPAVTRLATECSSTELLPTRISPDIKGKNIRSGAINMILLHYTFYSNWNRNRCANSS